MKYELTLTLRPQLYRMSAKEQFEYTRTLFEDIFRDFPNPKRRIMRTIVAELTGEHNIHYHCVVELADLTEKDTLMNRFRKHNKVFGRKTCNQVMYENSYSKYILKHVIDGSTRTVIKDYCPIVIDDFGILGLNLWAPETINVVSAAPPGTTQTI